MRWLRTPLTLLSLILIAAALVTVLRLLPATYSAQQTRTIEAGAEAIWPFLDEPQRWVEWNPWLEGDPTVELTVEERVGAPGPLVAWEAAQLRPGALDIVQRVPNERLEAHVQGAVAQSVHAIVTWELRPVDAQRTELLWQLNAFYKSPLERWLGLLLPLYVEPDYAEGLERLEALVLEARAEAEAQDDDDAAPESAL